MCVCARTQTIQVLTERSHEQTVQVITEAKKGIISSGVGITCGCEWVFWYRCCNPTQVLWQSSHLSSSGCNFLFISWSLGRCLHVWLKSYITWNVLDICSRIAFAPFSFLSGWTWYFMHARNVMYHIPLTPQCNLYLLAFPGSIGTFVR